MASEEDKKKTRRIQSPGLPDPDITYTAAPSETGGTGGLSDASTGTEIVQPPDRFTLNAVLGEGSQGEVCKAFDNLLQRYVAIKFPHRVGDEGTAREILVEARKAARLNHPNVVTIYEVGFWKNRPFIAMEMVEGVSLATVLKECGRISVDRYLRYARQVLKALCAAHDSGLIHRDLKPHNVLLAGDGTLKLTDFGIAHIRNETSGKDSTINISISGTPAYMAPEQWLGKKPDARSDIYAFGCLSFKLLAGKNVFPNQDTMQHHLETAPPRLRDIAPHIPENLDAILMRCLEKKPSARFQSSAELLHAIDAASQDDDAPGTAKWPAVEKKSRVGTILLAALVLTLIPVGWFTLSPDGKKQYQKISVALGLSDPPQHDDHSDAELDVPELDHETHAKAEKRGMAFLAQAEATMDLDERINLAEKANDLLIPESKAKARAAALIVEAKAERERTTEKMVLTEFANLLKEVKSLRAKGEIRAAEIKLYEAEEKYDASDYLRNQGSELKTIKFRLLTDLTEECKAAGNFAAASDYFDEAGRIADMLKSKGQRDRYKIEAEICLKLGRLQKLVESQPSYVLSELRDMAEACKKMPATLLMSARAWREMGAPRRARKDLTSFLEANPNSPLVAEAEMLKKTLAP